MKVGTRIWALVTVVVVAALLAGGWFLGAAPLLDSQARLETERKATLASNQQIEANIAKLAKEEENLPKLQARAKELEQAIPRDVESAAFITSLNNLAASSAVTITSISMGEGIPYSTPRQTAEADGAPVPVTDQRINDGNFVLIPVSIEVSGGWVEVLNFLNGVQTSTRLVLANELDTTSTGTGAYTSTITGVMYALQRHDTPAAADGETDTASAEG